MLVDHLAEQTEDPFLPIRNRHSNPANQKPKTQQQSMQSLLAKVQSMAELMHDRLMDSDGYLREDIPVRETKETVTAISSLLGTILRHQAILENSQYQRQFDAAVSEVLSEMDSEYSTDFLLRLEKKLEALEQ